MKLDVGKLSTKHWLDLEPEVVSDIMLPKGFIFDEERRCFHYIARHCTSGGGQIIDAGAALGASAYCLASGLARNPSRWETRVHSYDRFFAEAEYVSALCTQYYRPVKVGEDMFDIYEFQVGKYRELIRPHRGDFMFDRWDGSRIDVLMVDMAKSPELNTRIMEQFFPCLVPGESLLVHQDFYFSWLSYIHISMQYLAHRFEIVDRLIPDCSRLFMLKDPITAGEFEHLRSIPREERIDLLDAFIDGEKGDSRAMARVNKLCQLYYDDDDEGYRAERKQLSAENPNIGPETKWGFQCGEIDALASKHWGEPGSSATHPTGRSLGVSPNPWVTL
jgi:hypothetical protein